MWDEVFFRSDWEAVARAGAVDLWTVAGRETPYDAVVRAICTGVESVLNVRLVPGTFTIAEEQRTRELQGEYAVLSAIK